METEHKATAVPLVLFAVALMISPGQSGANQTAPANYAQCVKAVKKTASNTVASETAHSCLEKFPRKRLSDKDLPSKALDKLDTDGGFGYGIFSGSIYNGNGDYTVTQVTLLLTPLSAETSLVAREHNIDVTVPPFAKGALSMALTSNSTREFAWSLIKARGYKAH